MPKNRGRSEKSRSQRSLGQKLSDVTLNDFANATVRGGRLKKSATSSAVKEVKQICSGAEAELAWYEKDLEDFTIDFQLIHEDQENCDIEPIPTRSRKQKKGSKSLTDLPDDDKGVEYPLDIWFLLAEYVKPEDVGRFASICQSTLYVVNTPKFWFTLYKRYYNADVSLPQRLRPECMERPHSLRACVIRSLFYMYPPFIERVRSLAPFESEPHGLTSCVCMLMWHRKHRTAWDFFFKFHRGFDNSDHPERNTKRPDLLEMLDDVHANSENGCKVLQVTCLNFVSIPAVMGMYLGAVALNVGHKMHHHKLKLTFSNASYRRSLRNQDVGNVTMTFDPVSNIRVMNWWHPHYPYNEV